MLDAFFRLVDKGIINPDEIYAQKHEEIIQAGKDAHDELARRVEEDKRIQAERIKEDAAKANEANANGADAEGGDE